MVFVFGVDIPLVEVLFVLALVLMFLLALLIIVIVNQHRINQRLKLLVSEERTELKDLRLLTKEEKEELEDLQDIRKEEKEEIGLLEDIRKELDKILAQQSTEKKITQFKRSQKRIRHIREKVRKKAHKVICPRCHHRMRKDGRIKAGVRKGWRAVYGCPVCHYKRITDETVKGT